MERTLQTLLTAGVLKFGVDDLRGRACQGTSSTPCARPHRGYPRLSVIYLPASCYVVAAPAR